MAKIFAELLLILKIREMCRTDGISGVLDGYIDIIRNSLHEADGSFFDTFFEGSFTCVGCVRNAEDLDAPHRILAILPQLNLRHLYAVIILSEELNFTRAARRMQISQPALSRKTAPQGEDLSWNGSVT